MLAWALFPLLFIVHVSKNSEKLWAIRDIFPLTFWSRTMWKIIIIIQVWKTYSRSWWIVCLCKLKSHLPLLKIGLSQMSSWDFCKALKRVTTSCWVLHLDRDIFLLQCTFTCCTVYPISNGCFVLFDRWRGSRSSEIQEICEAARTQDKQRGCSC